MNAIIIVCGPTASGKSHLAQLLAAQLNGVIINADSMQIYRELRVLTARPTVEEEALAPHLLYGELSGATACSAGKWLELAKSAIDKVMANEQIPIVTGGTGLYLKTLMEGISPIPEVLPEIRTLTINLFNGNGADQFHKLLKLRDPLAAEKIRPSDTQRLIRAYEVMEQTGHSLTHWQKVTHEVPYRNTRFITVEMDIPRDLLYANCDLRFTRMVEKGAVEEVEQLMAMNLPPALPVMKAVGVPELAKVLQGEWSLEEAIAKARQATRNYAKRQITWLRHQMHGNIMIRHDFSPDGPQIAELLQEIGKSVDPAGQNL